MNSRTIGEESWARTTAWLLGANILRNVGLIVILILLARITNSDTVGRYALALAIATPTFVFAQLGLKGVYLTLRLDHRFSSYVAVQLAVVALALLVSVGASLLLNRDLTLTVALVSVNKISDALSELFSGPLQKYDRTRQIFWANLAGAAAGTAVTATALMTTRNLDIALACLAVTSLLTAVGLLWLPARKLVRHREGTAHTLLTPRQDQWSILKAGVPTGISLAVLSLVSSMPQYFLANNHGNAAVGYFAVLLYLFAIVDIFSGTLTQAWIPKARTTLAEYQTEHFHFVKSVLATAGKWMLAFIPLTIIGLWVMSFAIPLVFGAAYQLTIDNAIPLAIGIVILPSLHFGGIAVSVQNFYIHGITLSISSAAISLVACALLVPPFGVDGALWAVALAFATRGCVAFGILLYRARVDRNPQLAH